MTFPLAVFIFVSIMTLIDVYKGRVFGALLGCVLMFINLVCHFMLVGL
jgi:hypothetical protein